MQGSGLCQSTVNLNGGMMMTVKEFLKKLRVSYGTGYTSANIKFECDKHLIAFDYVRPDFGNNTVIVRFRTISGDDK